MCVLIPIIIYAGAIERADDSVRVEYLAERLSLSTRTILSGKAGTLPLLKLRTEKHPSRWRRADVDRWIAENAQRKQSRISLVRRSKRPAA
jgi:predicted DNA-binding transcriptional regulator AlpA